MKHVTLRFCKALVHHLAGKTGFWAGVRRARIGFGFYSQIKNGFKFVCLSLSFFGLGL